MRTIRISDEVWEEIAKRGKFGETPDNVLRRVFKIDERSNPIEGLKSVVRPRYATNKQSAWVSNNLLNIEYEGGASKNWPLPPPIDKAGLRKVLHEALEFGTKSGASQGQLDAIRKTLHQAGYHLTR